jgi:hypothetical protein
MYETIRDRVLQCRRSAEEIHLFAYPRVGSHFLVYCLHGLYDLIIFPSSKSDNPEVSAREQELDPHALYALELREDGAAHRPIWVNATPNGIHGMPVASTNRKLILIREPQATIYSLYRVNRDRWGASLNGRAEAVAWINERLTEYHNFYQRAFTVRDSDPTQTCLVRYEDLLSSPETLKTVVAFIGKPTKLSPEFVFWVTNFDRFALTDKQRTFYRTGKNTACSDDLLWQDLRASIAANRWAGFDYGVACE